MKKLLYIILFYSSVISAQDSVIYSRKVINGKIIDYSPLGVLVKSTDGIITHYQNKYKRLVFSDSLVVYNREGIFRVKNDFVDTLYLKDGRIKLFTKYFFTDPKRRINTNELLFYYPKHGKDYYVIKKSDILKMSDRNSSVIGKTKHEVSTNNINKTHFVFLKNGVVFNIDYCYFKRRKLLLEDSRISHANICIKKIDLQMVIYSDSTKVVFDSTLNNKPKKYPSGKFIKPSRIYPYWTKKNFTGINLTNFLMCDLNLSYYRAFFKNRIDLGVGFNIPIYSTSGVISNLSTLNNQYSQFEKNYEVVLSAEYYIFHSEFFKNISVGLIFRHTNYNYNYVDNSRGYYKNDQYKFIETRSNKIANARFLALGYFIPIRKCFFFKANLGLGWEEYYDPYQLYKGQDLNGSSVAAYTNFMAGFKF